MRDALASKEPLVEKRVRIRCKHSGKTATGIPKQKEEEDLISVPAMGSEEKLLEAGSV